MSVPDSALERSRADLAMPLNCGDAVLLLPHEGGGNAGAVERAHPDNCVGGLSSRVLSWKRLQDAGLMAEGRASTAVSPVTSRSGEPRWSSSRAGPAP